MQSSRTTKDGVRIYSPVLLAIYDFLIMRVLTPYVWRCSAQHYAQLYRDFMSRNHADVGVGTGYFLDRCAYEPGEVRIGLFDLQRNCLEFTARRIARFEPETYQCDALKPIPFHATRFDSIALGGILHCIPGDMAEKGAVFDSIQPLMHANTKVFGYTILNQGIRKTLLSRAVYFMLQKLKVINGLNDSAGQLAPELKKRFKTIEVKTIGCMAIFVAHSPLQAAH
ncbi:MAG: class I SAM-dependent methyltransferase [Burkholderiales bacterium]|nr:class I SAM-dependent methyltransferase [Burkholderiales bacterium]